MFKLAYVNKDKINNSITEEVISNETLIVTNNEEDSGEVYYYDEKGNLKQIVKKTRFENENEARLWVAKYGNYEGETISIKNKNGDWISYNVINNNQFSQVPNENDLTDILDGLIIDGGSAPTA